MNNKKLVIAALSILSSATAFADGNCANFSGNWVGTCNTNGQVTQDQISIEQGGCEEINLGGLVSVIGTTKTYSGSQGDIQTTVTISTQWSADRTQLPGHLVILKRSLSTGQQQQAEFYTGMGMDGSRLVIAAKSSQGAVVQCSYDRR